MTHSSSTSVLIEPVRTRRIRRLFLTFPWTIYGRDPLWVPPVLTERAARIDPSRNPLFQKGQAEVFLAWRGGEPVGTIGVAIDSYANLHRDKPVAIFGFFECLEDEAVARALLDQAVAWGRERGMAVLRGPQSFGSNDEPGLLIEGRETPRGLLMGWTPPYYQSFVESYGFTKYGDSLAYRVYLRDYVNGDGEFVPPGNVRRLADYIQTRYGERCRVRFGNLQEWDAELELARTIYNQALTHLRDFTPMSQDEWMRMAGSIRQLLSEELVAFVELDGKAIAFGLALPDINQALWHCNGLRAPWDYAKLWWYSRRLPGISFKIMAMLPEYHGLGLDILIYLQIAEASWRGAYQWADLSLTGDGNPVTNKIAAKIGAHVDKRYRVYDLDLNSAFEPQESR